MIGVDISGDNSAFRKFADSVVSALAGPTHVDIYVPMNSDAADYAKKMHDEKGQTWKNRGVGTVAKGPQADDEFIERAIEDKEDVITRRFSRAFREAARGRTDSFKDALTDVGLTTSALAKDYAPRSMSKAEYLQTLKTEKGRKNSVALLNPGQLQDSITFEVG